VRYPVRALVSLRRVPWRPVLLSFVVARVVVVATLAVADAIPGTTREGLLVWDADWYLRIALDGYDGVPAEGHRFFPLLPMLGYVLGFPLGENPGIALVLLANVSALGYAMLARQVALREGFDERIADRVPWVVAFAPAAFVLVMGYTEALFGILVCCVLLAIRSERWWAAAGAGLLAGLLRPTGVVLVLPILIEALRPGAASWRERVARTAAVLGPLAGLGSFLLWSWVLFADPLRPLVTHTEPGLRGGVLLNPLAALGRVVNAMAGGSVGQLAPVVHLPWMVLALVLLYQGRRLLPASFTAFAAGMILLGVTAYDYASFERYASSAVPLLITGAVLLETPSRRRLWLVVGVVAMAGYSLAAFLRFYVP
jgi:hypothetical protein